MSILIQKCYSKSFEPDDPSASIDLAFSNAEYFGVGAKDARNIAVGIATVVSEWHKVAQLAGLSRAEIDRMASAFQHEDLKKALPKAA